MLKQDIITAQRIVSGHTSNLKKDAFHDTSIIYKSTNERPISYQHHLKEKNSILSVIASGDQIINAMLENPTTITGFDISSFPKYFMYLKLAAIQSLEKDAYIDFFFESPDTSEKYDDIYDIIRKNLSEENEEFWDSLFNFFDWYDIYNSSLFSRETVIAQNAVKQNPYLQGINYSKLKKLIPGITLKTKTGNIFDMNFNEEYDFINLSNIIYYNDPNQYKELLKRLPLKERGKALTYIYKIEPQLIDFFQGEEFSFETLVEETSGIMIYTKKR